jgi:hypothetical protein
MTDIVQAQAQAHTLEKVLVHGDLAALSPAERMNYYNALCSSVGLNPLSRPFEYLKLSGRLTLYARKDATDQLRSIHGISVELVERTRVDDCYVVLARATNAYGRRDESTGVVSIKGLSGESLANALMKAETKAKRRVTLSICGLGMLDETEADTIPGVALDQNRRIQDIREGLGVSRDEVIAMLATFGATSPNQLTPEQCDQLEQMIRSAAK